MRDRCPEAPGVPLPPLVAQLRESCEASARLHGGTTYHAEELGIFRAIAAEQGLFLSEAPAELAEPSRQHHCHARRPTRTHRPPRPGTDPDSGGDREKALRPPFHLMSHDQKTAGKGIHPVASQASANRFPQAPRSSDGNQSHPASIPILLQKTDLLRQSTSLGIEDELCIHRRSRNKMAVGDVKRYISAPSNFLNL